MLTEEKVKELITAALAEHAKANPGVTADALNSAVNTAITARLKRELEGDAFKASLGEAVKAAVAAAAPTPDPGKGTGKGKDEGDSPQLKELKDLILKEREAREKAEEAQRSQARRGALVEALTGLGIDKTMLEPAIAIHLERIEHTEAGEIAYRGEDPIKPHQPVADALKSWAETDVGKRFMPPRDAAGSGNRGGTLGTTGEDGKTTYSDADLGNALLSL